MSKNEKSGRVIYLAGPMRGYPRYNFDAFARAANDLRQRGFMVWSPADLDTAIGFDPDKDVMTDTGREKALLRDYEYVCKSDEVVVLPGWERSSGSLSEMMVAWAFGRPIRAYPDLNEIEQSTLAAALYPQAEPGHGEEDVLEEALRLTKGDRQNAYGPADQDFRRTAMMWTAILGVEVTSVKVALCMMALKISRAVWMGKRDNWVDAAGYARCGWQCEQAELARTSSPAALPAHHSSMDADAQRVRDLCK